MEQLISFDVNANHLISAKPIPDQEVEFWKKHVPSWTYSDKDLDLSPWIVFPCVLMSVRQFPRRTLQKKKN